MKKIRNQEQFQLSLFEPNEPPPTPVKEITPATEPSVLEFIKARFENGTDMTPEEYKRWIKILIHHSLRSME